MQQPSPAVVPEGKGLLINRNFALLAVGQAISNLGDFVYSTTLLIWVFTLTHSAAAVSGVVFAQYAPIFLLGPFAGVFVDRWNRKQTMLIADFARTFIALMPLLVPFFLRLPAIYASVFLIGALGRFFAPAKSGVLQVVVNSEQQAQAASISQTAFALSFVVGPAIAAPLYAITGPVVALLINAGSYLVSALTLLGLQASREALHPYASMLATASKRDGQARQVQNEQNEQSAQGGLRAVFRDLIEGFLFVLRTRVLLVITLMALIAMLGSGALNALDIVFAVHNLHIGTQLYGNLVAACGLGTLVGAILAGVLSKWVKPQRILTGGVLLLGLGIVVYAFQTQYIIALIISFVLCIPQGGIDVGFGPLLINTTPQQLMGRTMAVIETGMYGASLLSIAIAGYVGQVVPVNIIFGVSGALLALGGLFGWLAMPRTIPTIQSMQSTQKSQRASSALLTAQEEMQYVSESVDAPLTPVQSVSHIVAVNDTTANTKR